MSHYGLRCRKCGKLLEGAWCAFCEHCRDALLVTDYGGARFSETGRRGRLALQLAAGALARRSCSRGPACTAPAASRRTSGSRTCTSPSTATGRRRARCSQTCTFKEFEAAVVLQNARENGIEGLIVASAGNTARSFAYLSAQTGFPVVIVVPAMCLTEMWYLERSTRRADGGGRRRRLFRLDRRRQAGRRDPRVPVRRRRQEHRQARRPRAWCCSRPWRPSSACPTITSRPWAAAPGPIGVWEMAERFLADGRFGDRLPVLHLAQNLPFAPMAKAWARQERRLEPEDLRPELIPEITTRVLSTRYPAYTIAGGVYDALTATGGRMYGVRNEEVYAAMELFQRTEGVDIVPAAGVAVAALEQAVGGGRAAPGRGRAAEHHRRRREEPGPEVMTRTLRRVRRVEDDHGQGDRGAAVPRPEEELLAILEAERRRLHRVAALREDQGPARDARPRPSPTCR